MDLIIFLNVINYIKNHTHSPTYKSDFTLESVGQGDKIFVEIIRVSYHGHNCGNISKNPSTTKGSAATNAVSQPPHSPCCCQPTLPSPSLPMPLSPCHHHHSCRDATTTPLRHCRHHCRINTTTFSTPAATARTLSIVIGGYNH